MGQIAACLTDLICLIEQHDAFGFTSPSKAGDCASVKTEGGKKESKIPHPSIYNSLKQTSVQLSKGLFIGFKCLIHDATTKALSGHQPLTKPQAQKICQLSESLIGSRSLGGQ